MYGIDLDNTIRKEYKIVKWKLFVEDEIFSYANLFDC